MAVCILIAGNAAIAGVVDVIRQAEAARAPRATVGPCDDANFCTDDVLDPVNGCVHTPNTYPCDDGLNCTTGDRCAGGACHGIDNWCDDFDPCTIDACFEPGECVWAPVPCDDGDACTVDWCEFNEGCQYAAIDCDDGSPCTDDSCDPASGCAHVPDDSNACPDATECTTDICSSGTCTHEPVVCGPTACGPSTCDPTRGCFATACDDGIACTTDSCAPAAGCVHVPNSALCDDLNPCTDDACAVGVGCVHTPDDTNLCTGSVTCYVYSCVGGSCVQGGTACDDGYACNIDVCRYGQYGAYCDHVYCHELGNACESSCLPGGGCGPPNCDDGNACTQDACQLHGTWHDYQCRHDWVGGEPPDLPLQVSRTDGVATVSWQAGTYGQLKYDVLRGMLGELPVGSTAGDGAELCMQNDTPAVSLDDAENPDVGTGFWYLVRQDRGCGSEWYGRTFGGGNSSPWRFSNKCP